MHKALPILLLIAILLVSGCTSAPAANAPTATPDAGAVPDAGSATATPEPSATPEPALKTFSLTGDHFRFLLAGVESPDLRVSVGDRVRIEFTSEDGSHDWVIDEFNARTPLTAAGKSSSVEFIADFAGTFEYYCGVPGHRANGMKGSLIVE